MLFGTLLILFLVLSFVVTFSSDVSHSLNGPAKNDVTNIWDSVIDILGNWWNALFDQEQERIDVDEISISETIFFTEHRTTKNGKGRTEQIHQKGLSRKKRDKAGGEKGDLRRPFRRHKKSRIWWILFFMKRRKKYETNSG